ncbi:MAG: hypothetical protein ACR2GG_10615 [Gemmatimonadaceae bacterium]
MTAFATPQDLADFIDQPVKTTRAALLLTYASALIRQVMPHTDIRIANFAVDPATPAALDPGLPRMVCVQVVKRYLENPAGASTMSTGPYSVSFVDRYQKADGSANIKGSLSLTASDLADLRPYSPRTRVGSIRLAAALGPRRTPGGWVLESAELEQIGGLPSTGALNTGWGE